MINEFIELGLRKEIVNALAVKNIVKPTEIQLKVIPLMLQNKDVVAESATGTGKTFAYLLPLFEKLDTSVSQMQAIIVVPTHELAVQVLREVEFIESKSQINLKGTVVVGKVNIDRQINKLKQKPEIIVGTAGRILELIKMKKISAHTIRTLIIDEADRLIDKNNIDSINGILKAIYKTTQITMFSATIDNKTLEKSLEILKSPEIIKINNKMSVPESIEHMYFVTEQRNKIEVLRKLVRIINPVKAIAFVNKSNDIASLTEKLKFHGLKVEGLDSSLKKIERKKIMDDFKRNKIQVLVSSDLASRGLDIEDVTHIFNYDLPERVDNFLHRVGRTGRSGKKGVSVSIITNREIELIKSYRSKLNIDIKLKDMYKGVIIDKKDNKTKSTT